MTHPSTHNLLLTQEFQQHDAQELNRILFSAIEDSLMGTQGQSIIKELYHGTIVNQVGGVIGCTCRVMKECSLDNAYPYPLNEPRVTCLFLRIHTFLALRHMVSS